MNESTEPDLPPRPHVIHLLRTVQQNQLQLIMMADQKANILIGGALILLTILAAQIVRGEISPALLVLAASVMLAAIFAILAAKPRILPPPDRDSEKFNLLFFGHFGKLTQPEFTERFEQVIEVEAAVYRVMIRDIHQMGLVLKGKYRYLAYSYRSFLVGLGLTAVAFLYQMLVAGL